METLQALFANKLVDDDREPILTFTLRDEQWGLLAPKFELWYQLLLLLFIQTAFQCTMAVIVYHGIVVPRMRPRNGMTTAYLLGWGMVIPLAIYVPFVILETLVIRNRCIKTASTTSTAIVAFRTIEAMYGTSPPVVESSVSTYVTYYSSIVHFIWNPKTGARDHLSLAQLAANGAKLLWTAVSLSAFLSLEMHYNFEPFASRIHLQDFTLDWNLVSWSHLANMYGLAVLTNLTLSFGLGLAAIGEQIKGSYATEPIFFNPLWTSASPSDFWGRKWNRLIHLVLKYGTFQPARQFVSTPMAIFITFVMSGLFHDYVWTLMFYKYATDGCAAAGASSTTDCYTPARLKLTAFFAWNGLVMLVEQSGLGRTVGRVLSHWPRPLVSTLVVLTALPVSHWYTGDWVSGGYFAHLSLGLWIVRKLNVAT